MGMTIDEALHHLHTYSSTLGSGQTTQAQHEEAKRVAIDVMRKYQKQERVLDKIRERDIRIWFYMGSVRDNRQKR